jgi:predicted RNase H-like HicB family nuclease
MTYTIIYEKIDEPGFEKGYYYAHIPAFDLTTHGLGIEGAKEAALDLLKLWIKEKKANGEAIKSETDTFVSKIDIEDALLS